jgi:hypothetical protein
MVSRTPIGVKMTNKETYKEAISRMKSLISYMEGFIDGNNFVNNEKTKRIIDKMYTTLFNLTVYTDWIDDKAEIKTQETEGQ